MIFVILIALLVIALIASGLGVDFWVVVVALIAILCIAAVLTPDKKDSEEKAKRKKLILKVLLISVAVAVVIAIIIGIVGLFDTSSPDAQYDDMMAGYDYGDNYYYDSNDNAVKEKPW